MIRAALFDIGNVLVRFDFSLAIQSMAERSPLAPSAIEAALRDRLAPLESGKISSSEFTAQLISAIQYQGTAAEFASSYCDIFSPNQPMWETVERFSASIPCYHLSNTSELHQEYLFGSYPIFHTFAGGAYSWQSGCMKPEEKIYIDAISLTDFEPAEILYLDDLAPNIDTGKRLGLQCFHYHPDKHGEFLHALSSLGL